MMHSGGIRKLYNQNMKRRRRRKASDQIVRLETTHDEDGLTVDGQVDPRSVAARFLSRAVEEDDRAFVPALIAWTQVADLDRRLLDESYATLVARVDVRRISVELDEDGHLYACQRSKTMRKIVRH